jgi:hypothetical protein
MPGHGNACLQAGRISLQLRTENPLVVELWRSERGRSSGEQLVGARGVIMANDRSRSTALHGELARCGDLL